MFSLTIFAGMPWKLLFSDEARAKEAFEMLTNSPSSAIQFVDDFGSSFCAATPTAVTAVILEDLDKSQMAQVEMGLHQARTQAKAQTMAMADPKLAAAIRAQQMGAGGPAVYRPGMS